MGPSNSSPVQATDALAHFLRPGHAPDQRIVEAAALEGHGMRELAQLDQLQQDRSLGQVRDVILAWLAEMRSSLQVQFRRPFALELFARQLQALVGGLHVAQCRRPARC